MIHTDGLPTIASRHGDPLAGIASKRADLVHDFTVENGGSVYLLRAISPACEDWIAEHVVGETSYFGGALVVEPRYVQALVEGLEADGFTGEHRR